MNYNEFKDDMAFLFNANYNDLTFDPKPSWKTLFKETDDYTIHIYHTTRLVIVPEFKKHVDTIVFDNLIVDKNFRIESPKVNINFENCIFKIDDYSDFRYIHSKNKGNILDVEGK